VELFDKLLARYKYGCPEVEVETLLTKYLIQIGDLVTITNSDYIDYGKDGITSSDKWEVVGKETDVFASPPKIKWRLAYAGTNAITRTGRAPFSDYTLDSGKIEEAGSPSITQAWVESGLNVTIDAGLVGDLQPGVTTNGTGWRTKIAEAVAKTYTASKDTYVFVDIVNGGIAYHEVANGAAAPSLPDHMVLVSKVITDGAAITSVDTDVQNTKRKLKDAIVIPSSLDGEARTQHGTYLEAFDVYPHHWEHVNDDAVKSITATGQTGGNAVSADGYLWLVDDTLIPFDDSKLYRMRARVRMTERDDGPDADDEWFYAGVVGVAADKTTLVNSAGADTHSNQHYICASAAHVFTDAGGLDTWHEYTGWFKGWDAAGDTSPSTDPTDPQVLHEDVRYMRPMFVCNYFEGTGTMEVDYLSIEVMDEDAIDRVYNSIKDSASSYQINTDKVVTDSILALNVTEAKVANLAITEGKIGALAVTEGKIGALAVTESKIRALAVTSGKIGAKAVITAKIDDEAVEAGQVADNAIAVTHWDREIELASSINPNATLTTFTRG